MHCLGPICFPDKKACIGAAHAQAKARPQRGVLALSAGTRVCGILDLRVLFFLLQPAAPLAARGPISK